MPQASPELYDIIVKCFGGVDDEPVTNWLEGRGFTLNRDWTWSRPGATLENIAQDEYLAILFLRDEWDYGMLKE